ncbi:MAG: hypothetical protein J2O44_08125, partial [Porphyrobacter sp.]|nr:hypothetical protein [Porphyrobacter sp.]
MKRAILAAALALAAALPAIAQQAAQKGPTAEDIHEMERQRFGFGSLQPGRDSDQKSPRAANFDEAKVGNLEPPPLFASSVDATKAGWVRRRAALARLIEDNWVGRVPAAASKLKVVWRKEKGEDRKGYPTEQWIGQILAPDGRSGPTIDATITFPKHPRRVPALIDYTYIWPPGFTLKLPGPPPPDTTKEVLDAGWAQVAYRPQLIQADNAAQMQQGIIGLVHWPRG